MAAAKQEHTLTHTQLRRTPRHMLQTFALKRVCGTRGGWQRGATLLRQMCAAASLSLGAAPAVYVVFATLIEWENVLAARVLREQRELLHLRRPGRLACYLRRCIFTVAAAFGHYTLPAAMTRHRAFRKNTL